MVRELLAVVVRAALQWALASLLLANGAAFCLIAAAASALRLGPPCLLCARVHRLLGCYSSAASAADGPSGHEHQALRRLLCDAHVAAVAGSGPEQRLEKTCSASDHVDGRTRDDSDKPGGLEAHRAVSIGSEICEQDRGSDQDDVERSSSIGNDGPYVSLFELAPISPRLPADQHNPQDSAKELDDESTPEPKREIGMPSSVALQAGNGREEEDQEERDLITVSGLFAELRAQRKELRRRARSSKPSGAPRRRRWSSASLTGRRRMGTGTITSRWWTSSRGRRPCTHRRRTWPACSSSTPRATEAVVVRWRA